MWILIQYWLLVISAEFAPSWGGMICTEIGNQNSQKDHMEGIEYHEDDACTYPLYSLYELRDEWFSDGDSMFSTSY